MATTEAKSPTKPSIYRPRLRLLYDQEIVPQLMSDLGLKNKHEVPRLERIVINSGLGKALNDKRLMEVATNTLSKITGQQPLPTSAKNSVAGFKLREGNKIGLKVTLRDARMYEFMDRLINLVLPQLRDFHGVSPKSFDRQGNFAIGLSDQSVFSELSYEETSLAHGLQAIFVINTKDKNHARALLESFGMPFEKEAKENG